MRSNSNTPIAAARNADGSGEITDGFRLFPWGYTQQRTFENAGQFSVQELAAVLIERLPEELLVKNEVINLGGSASTNAGYGELLTIEYLTKDPADETAEQRGTFRIQSRFARFEGGHSIVFALERTDTEGASNPRSVLLDSTKRIESITIQLQWYERRWASLFGLFPVPTRSMVLRLSSTWLAAEIIVQRQPTKLAAQSHGTEIFNRWVHPLLPSAMKTERT